MPQFSCLFLISLYLFDKTTPVKSFSTKLPFPLVSTNKLFRLLVKTNNSSCQLDSLTYSGP